MTMKFLSICSGIEAASVAFKDFGWTAVGFSEIEEYPSAVLKHHYPDIPNLGDMTKYREWPDSIYEQADAIVGGPPCQAFSKAGNKEGLNDERGNLTLVYANIIEHADNIRKQKGLKPVVVLYENVPGILSDKTNAIGCFLGELSGAEEELIPSGKRWSNSGIVIGSKRSIAWRTLNAQYFGVPQRRRRVFIVASAREDFSPQEVLFEYKGNRWNDKETNRKESTGGFPTTPSINQKDDVVSVDMNGYGSWWNGNQVSQTLDAVLYKKQCMPEKNRFPAVLVPAWSKCNSCDDYLCNIHLKDDSSIHAHDCDCPGIEEWSENDLSPYDNVLLRFITPVEAERLQGFPDGYTDITFKGKPVTDNHRYKALGNSWAVPVVKWIWNRVDTKVRM